MITDVPHSVFEVHAAVANILIIENPIIAKPAYDLFWQIFFEMLGNDMLNPTINIVQSKCPSTTAISNKFTRMLSLLKNQSVIEGPGDFPPVDEVIETFWGRPSPHRRLFNGQQIQALDMSAYADYFQRQWYAIAADADGRHMVAQKVEDIFQIVQFLVQGLHRDSIVSRLNRNNPTAAESACENSVDLAVRLFLMLKVGVVRHQANSPHCMKWENGNLSEFVRERFNKHPVLDCHHVRLTKSFDAWSISAIGGLKLEFTDNLADHLLLVDDDTTVLIFHHASFLECQTNPCLVDPRVALCGNLRAEERQIERFAFWRDRLIILKQIYDDATPKTIKQWRHDRRNGERWFTFWVAVLVLMITITLGLVQCIESAL
ncbi:hypothetical protein CHU98_g2720 [Xylaria longipes]|nr:hypothetical protein CHU98_g2720 [Xylaria longipes]